MTRNATTTEADILDWASGVSSLVLFALICNICTQIGSCWNCRHFPIEAQNRSGPFKIFPSGWMFCSKCSKRWRAPSTFINSRGHLT